MTFPSEITEADLVGCENLPAEMSSRFDQPWHFVGDVGPSLTGRELKVLCTQCNDVTHLQLYRYMNELGVQFGVYFGVCVSCDRVYWAYQCLDLWES